MHKTTSVITDHPITRPDGQLQGLHTHLDVIVGVPVRVIDDDGVSGGKIDPQTASSGREEESKLRSTGSC